MRKIEKEHLRNIDEIERAEISGPKLVQLKDELATAKAEIRQLQTTANTEEKALKYSHESQIVTEERYKRICEVV